MCEGHAERDFINEVLAPYAQGRYSQVSSPLVGKRMSSTAGGDVGWNRLGKELPNYLSQGHAVVTTFIDLFRLKSNMPGYHSPGTMASVARAASIESAMVSALSSYIRGPGHFVPYVQVHEYEALLFSSPDDFESATGHSGSADLIGRALRGLNSPE